METAHRLLFAGALALAACSPAQSTGTDGGGPPPGDMAHAGPGPDGGPPIDPCTVTDCSNVVDAVVVRMLADNGLPLVLEDPGVLCRRMAIDLTGLAPTQGEIDNQCTGHTAKEIATYFMNKPSGPNVPTQILDRTGAPVADPNPSTPYVFVSRRWWADGFQYYATSIAGTVNSYYAFARALDHLVYQLYSGTIGYDQFAAKALANPAFLRRFGIFTTNTDLVQIASQAYRLFLGREALPSEAEDFGNLWRAWKIYYMDEATSEAKYADCPLTAGKNGCYHYDVAIDSSLCAGILRASCQSSVLGPGEVVPPNGGVVAWPDFGAAEESAVEEPGRLIAAQPEFADAAVDRSLSRYLGWWKAGFFRPDYDIPAVRDALAKKFVADGYDVRKLDLEIVTSVLYSQMAARQPNENVTDPIWAFGPTKIMQAEPYLDTLGQALGKQLGGCDFVFSVGTQAPMPSMVFASDGSLKSGYAATARQLGGCPAASTHADPTGLVSSIARRTLLAALCPGAFPAAASNDAQLSAEFPGIGRDPSASERAQANARMGACDANVDKCTPQAMADALCTSLFASSLATYY